MDSSFSLSGQTALITGGGTGIGFGIASCMVRAGARVMLVGRRKEELAEACEKLGAQSAFIAHDITMIQDLDALVQKAETTFGAPLSILVNNAGIHLKKLAVDTTPEDFQKILETHVLAPHALTRAVIPGMLARGSGCILFISSMAAFMGVPQVIAYAAAKSAFFGMVSTLSAELSAKGVRINAIAPGWIFSEMTQRALDGDPVRKAKVFGRIQMGRMGHPEDIGHAAVYLCSPAASYVTGVTLPVDGGAVVGF